MIKSHREYKEAVCDYAIGLYFMGIHAGHVDISEINDIRKVYSEYLEELSTKLCELDEWVINRQPVLVHSDDRIERTPPRGRCSPVKGSTTTYIENRPAGIFYKDEIQPATSMCYDDRAIYAGKTRWKARVRLRKVLNAESMEFLNSLVDPEEE
jgi:hypothetical protein